MEKTNNIDQFIKDNRADILTELTRLVTRLKADIEADPMEYVDYGADNPSIDVRLCVDLADSNRCYGWIVRTGLVDYDPYFSEYCSAGSVGLDTDPAKLMAELLEGLTD